MIPEIFWELCVIAAIASTTLVLVVWRSARVLSLVSIVLPTASNKLSRLESTVPLAFLTILEAFLASSALFSTMLDISSIDAAVSTNEELWRWVRTAKLLFASAISLDPWSIIITISETGFVINRWMTIIVNKLPITTTASMVSKAVTKSSHSNSCNWCLLQRTDMNPPTSSPGSIAGLKMMIESSNSWMKLSPSLKSSKFFFRICFTFWVFSWFLIS